MLFDDYDLLTVDGTTIAIAKDGSIPVFTGSTLSEIALQIASYRGDDDGWPVRRDVERAQDQATETLREHPDVTDQDAPVYLHHYDLRTLTEQSAACYLAAGRADVAATILEDAIAATSSTLARDRGHLTSKLAVAITRTTQPDPARAASLGLEALSIARDTGSARIMRELCTRRNWPPPGLTASSRVTACPPSPARLTVADATRRVP